LIVSCLIGAERMPAPPLDRLFGAAPRPYTASAVPLGRLILERPKLIEPGQRTGANGHSKFRWPVRVIFLPAILSIYQLTDAL
jgi:hypothetical protein